MNKQNHRYQEIDTLITRYPVLEGVRESVENAVEMLVDTAKRGGKILVCGNGGSSADADHIVGELMKGFVLPRPLSREKQNSLYRVGGEEGRRIGSLLQQGIPALSLSAHTALNSAFMNDVDPSLVFAQQVIGLGNENDLFWALSTSGNSGNVVSALIAARAIGMKTLGMTGAKTSRISEMADLCIRVPEEETYKVQELHLPIYHALCLSVETRLFGATGNV